MKLLSPLEMVRIEGVLCFCPQWLVRKHFPSLLEQSDVMVLGTPGRFPHPAPPAPAAVPLLLCTWCHKTDTQAPLVASLRSVESKSPSLELAKEEPWP